MPTRRVSTLRGGPQALTVRRVQVRVETVVDGSDLEVLHPLYLRAFAPLVTRAAARHVLTRAEFDGEMADPRILKVLVRDDDGVPAGLTTLTRDLTAVPWVNPSYFWTRFPDAAGRDALFYLGYIFIDPERRRSQALLLMASEIKTHLEAAHGVVGFDTCAYTNEHGIGRWSGWLFGPQSTVSGLDTQTYSVADYRRGRLPDETTYPRHVPADDLRLVTLAERPDLTDEIGALLLVAVADLHAGRAARPRRGPRRARSQAFPSTRCWRSTPRTGSAAWPSRCRSTGTAPPAGLPTGWDDAVTPARPRCDVPGGPADAATALSITVASDAARRGLAVRLIEALRRRHRPGRRPRADRAGAARAQGPLPARRARGVPHLAHPRGRAVRPVGAHPPARRGPPARRRPRVHDDHRHGRGLADVGRGPAARARARTWCPAAWRPWSSRTAWARTSRRTSGSSTTWGRPPPEPRAGRP